MQLSSDFEDALAYAARIHRKQRRKGADTPYVAHLLAVAAIVLEHGADENEAIAALLHDAVEDQGGQARLVKIEKRFGDRVAAIVEGCSDTDISPKPPWKERKEDYIAHLREAPYSVRLVVAADKLHNVRDVYANCQTPGIDFWSEFKGGRDGTLWYYREVANALTDAAGPDEVQLNDLIDELDQAVGWLERLVNEQDQPTPSP